MGRRILSFSLWGDNPVYTTGAVRNAEAARSIYPGWECVFHVFDSVPAETVRQLRAMDHCEIRRIPGPGDNRGMFDRFMPAAEPGVDFAVFRDADSRLSPREKAAVDAWIASGCDLHIMRDHPHHAVPMMGGMWGVRGGVLRDIGERIAEFNPTGAKGQDQVFLGRHVWTRLGHGLTACVHDPFFAKKAFPPGIARGPANGGVWFIGEVFDARDQTANPTDIRHLFAAERAAGPITGPGASPPAITTPPPQ